MACNRGVQCLTSLDISHLYDHKDDFGCTDATASLVAIIRHQPLKKVTIQGYFGDDNEPGREDYKSSLHKCEAEPVVAALLENSSLEILHLKQMSFRHKNVEAIPPLFSQVFDKNTTLYDFVAYGQKRSFTLPRPNKSYYVNDYDCALKIQHSLWINKFGCKQLHETDMTLDKFVLLLLKARWSLEKETSEFCDIVATEQQEFSFPADSLSNIFCNLQCGVKRPDDIGRAVTVPPQFGRRDTDVETWCDAAVDKQNAVKTSILYRLLRESPSLWCLPTSALNYKRKCSRGMASTRRPKRQATTHTNLGNIS